MRRQDDQFYRTHSTGLDRPDRHRLVGGEMAVKEAKASLTERLVISVLDAICEGDPMVVIGVGEKQIHLGWMPEWSRILGLDTDELSESEEVAMSDDNGLMAGVHDMLKLQPGEEVITAFPRFEDGSRAIIFAVVPGEGSASEKMESIISRWAQL